MQTPPRPEATDGPWGQTCRRLLAALLLLDSAAMGAGTNAILPAAAHGYLTEGSVGYKYVCYVPAVRTNSSQRLPLILFLHGACPNEDLTKFRHFGPMKYALTHADFRCIVVCPATARGWTLPALVQLLDHLQNTLPVDPERVYLTGYSMGGHGTWLFATAYPHRFAAIAPAAGAGNPQEAARKLRELPVWIFHGVNDEVVPFAYGETMARALAGVGGQVKTTFYPDKGHDIWNKPYEDPALYAWFLEQRRGAPNPRSLRAPAAPGTNRTTRSKPSAPHAP
jgi:predicted peptidase